MPRKAFTIHVRREDLPETLGSTQVRRSAFAEPSVSNDFRVEPKHIGLGYWDEPAGDPFPDFMIIRDDEYQDTQAWMSAYMIGLTPVSQWCRVWRASEFRNLDRVRPTPSLGARYAAWVGAIIAEYGSQSPSNLKEVSGAAALMTATYAAARATAVWNGFEHFDELGKRHEAVTLRHREAPGAVPIEELMPLWYVLAGPDWYARPPAEARALEPFSRLFDQLSDAKVLSQDSILDVAKQVAREFAAPEIALCAVGPQGQRVDALDKLGSRLLSGPRSPATSALMGLAASMIDPGTPVLPELLRRYSKALPAAAIWAGAFAGLWFPVRVLSEHSGFGRLIGKQLVATSDLHTKPRADVAFEEFSRWTGGSTAGRLQLRGLMLRSLFIELLPGVTVPIPNVRGDVSRTDHTSAAPPKQQSLELSSSSRAEASVRSESSAPTRSLQDVASRLERLEKVVAEIVRGATKTRQAASRGKNRTLP